MATTGALLGGMLLASPAHAGDLDKVRSEVRGEGSSSASGGGTRSGSNSDSSDDSSSWWDSDDDDAPAPSLGAWNGRKLLVRRMPRFARHPYKDGEPGYIRPMDKLGAQRDDTRLIAGTIQVEGGYVLDKIYRSGFAIDLNVWRVAAKSDLSFFVEGRLKDAMYLGSTNLAFAIIMRPRVRLRAGGGAQYMLDGRTPGQGHREYAAGGNFTADLDVFPFWPVVLSGRFDYGRIFKAPSMVGRGTLGLSLSGFELYGGYEYRRIGRVALQGPTAGLRVWF